MGCHLSLYFVKIKCNLLSKAHRRSRHRDLYTTNCILCHQKYYSVKHTLTHVHVKSQVELAFLPRSQAKRGITVGLRVFLRMRQYSGYFTVQQHQLVCMDEKHRENAKIMFEKYNIVRMYYIRNNYTELYTLHVRCTQKKRKMCTKHFNHHSS